MNFISVSYSRQAGSGTVIDARGARDDVRLHRPEHTEQFLLLPLRHLELVERFHEILDQRVEMCVVHPHASVRAFHVASSVGAWSAGARTDLLDEQQFEPRYVRFREESVDAVVGRDVADEIVDHGGDRWLTPEPLVE